MIMFSNINSNSNNLSSSSEYLGWKAFEGSGYPWLATQSFVIMVFYRPVISASLISESSLQLHLGALEIIVIDDPSK